MYLHRFSEGVRIYVVQLTSKFTKNVSNALCLENLKITRVLGLCDTRSTLLICDC